MSDKSKRGSSRRKGDEFQDLSALRLILELYRAGEDFRVFLEYEKAEAIDDIVAFVGQRIRAVQVKYAVDPLAVYVPDDFTEEKSRTYFGRYAAGWRKTRERHPGFEVTVELLSNRGRDSDLAGVIGPDGTITPEFIAGTIRKSTKIFREKLEASCGFTGVDAEEQFRKFLTAFQFQLSQRPIADLRGYIAGEILDHEFGISDRAVFQELKELIARHAVELHDPITPAHLDIIFRTAQRRFLLPQVFPVDVQHFVEVPAFGESLLNLIEGTDGGYIVVTGLPGSGKSTSLSEFFDRLVRNERFAICRYFCFVSPNDDICRLRLEAETLRVNLLTELHRLFSDLLDRQHDYGERRFAEVLAELGGALSSEGRKLVILLDGLDHAERDALVRENILKALPTALPLGVIIVVGTQELKNWQPLALRDGRSQRHVPIPLFTLKETRTFLVEKHGLNLSDKYIESIHRKSQGLPLYLRYVAAWVGEHECDPETLDRMPEAGDGDIRNYYERLWANFDMGGMSHARHMCGVLAALRFPVRLDELAEFQKAIPLVDVSSAIQAVAHLLHQEEQQVSIFHDSFRVFANRKLDEPTRQNIARGILVKLKSERGSPRWFANTFRYALEAEDVDFLLSEVNRPFVDFALQHCRPVEDVLTAIDAAAKAAMLRKDLVALARLGSLHFRTRERLEQFSYGMLAKVQLALGRVGDVLGFCCRQRDRRWLVDDLVAMEVMEWCAQTDQRELGEQLFAIFRETHAQREWSDRQESEALARVVGIYSKHPARFLRSIASLTFEPETLERSDRFACGFAPHLTAFLETFFQYGPSNAWRRMKRVKRLFPNQFIRHALLRLVARHRPDELASELEDYLANTPIDQNLEVAGYAVLAGLPPTRVRALAGPVILPPRVPPDSAHPASLESDLDAFEQSALLLGYEGDPAVISRVAAHIGAARTMYSGFSRFLLQAGLCLGRAAAGKHQDAYSDAVAALHELAAAGTEVEPREMDTLHACRPMLPEALFRLTRFVAVTCPQKLQEWCDELLALRQCEMWTSHWGVSETTEDYTFELRIWERLTTVPGVPSRLLPILRSCAKTYTEATALKAGSRCIHFLWLAAIAAQCGWRTEAEKWREKGVASSLTYGYHKDITLDYLVDVLELLNMHEPQHGLRRAASLLEMVRWMRAATDNRGTKYFEQSVFRIVLQTSREAAFTLVRFFRERAGRWKMLDCLEQFCVAVKSGDPTVLWTLKDVFTPHFHEQGRHSKQVIRATQVLHNLGQHIDNDRRSEWNQRYIRFIRTHIDPVWWPDDVWSEVLVNETRKRPQNRDNSSSSDSPSQREFMLEGTPTSRIEIGRILGESIDSFCRTIEQLRAENSYFYDRILVSSALSTHAARSTSRQSARLLWEVTQSVSDLVEAESLRAVAHRLFDCGASHAGFECLLLAYQRSSEYYPGSHMGQPYLVELCERDHERLANFLAERCEGAFRADHGGFDLPRMVARYLAAAGDVPRLRCIFEDYLTHCEELFAHLPRDERYEWLRNYQEGGRDEATEIVEFLVDLIGEPEIELARRLVRVLANLARDRPELVCSITAKRFVGAEPLLRERLEVLLDALASLCPNVLAPNLERMLPLFKKPHFRLRMTLVRISRTVAKAVTLPAAIDAATTEAERTYSPLIAYPHRRFFHMKPSPEFVRFLRQGLLFSLGDRIEGICNLLRVDVDIVLSALERSLRGRGWNEVEERKRLRSDWEGHVGNDRVIKIVSQFQIELSELLQEFVHQAVENGRYDVAIIQALENVLRAGDPEFATCQPQIKPEGIVIGNGTDSREWIEELRSPLALAIESLSPEGWTTVYEERKLSEAQDLHHTCISSLRVRSLLISPTLANDPAVWLSEEEWADQIPLLYPRENLTLKTARRRLLETVDAYNDLVDQLPLVTTHKNSEAFHGFRTLAFLHQIWINRYNLAFEGAAITFNGRCIARLEEWQEGYEDEVYSREWLSAGIRLVVLNDWIKMVLQESGKTLVTSNSEERRLKNDSWRSEPIATAKRTHFRAYVN